MSNRYNVLTVVLEQDIREEDAQTLIAAIRQLRGVLSVEANTADLTTHIATERARHELGAKLMAVLYPKRSAS